MFPCFHPPTRVVIFMGTIVTVATEVRLETICKLDFPVPIQHRSRGSHLYVACRSVCDHDQIFWLATSVLDRLIVPFWGSWSLDFQGSKVKLQPRVLDCWFLAVQRSPWSLDRPPKRALIAWFSFDPGRKRFYRGHVTIYPLQVYMYQSYKPIMKIPSLSYLK